MHFCVSAARVSRPGTAPGHLLTSGLCWPRKMGTNWFMPALVNSRFGASGSRLEDGTTVCCFDLKKSRNDWRICELVIRLAVKSLNYCKPIRPKRPRSRGEIIQKDRREASGSFRVVITKPLPSHVRESGNLSGLRHKYDDVH